MNFGPHLCLAIPAMACTYLVPLAIICLRWDVISVHRIGSAHPSLVANATPMAEMPTLAGATLTSGVTRWQK